MATEPTSTIKIFYSYAHEDRALRNELEKHLSVLQRQGQISEWHYLDIQAGKEWEREIDTHLNSAHIILLLVSPDFISSDYCYSVEMQKALRRHKVGEAHVIPIILRPVDWEETPIGELQVLPTDGKPVTLWSNLDNAFYDVARGIRHVVRTLRLSQSKEYWESDKTAPSHDQHSAATVVSNNRGTQMFYETINTKEAVSLFHQLMQPSSQIRVLRLIGKSNMGKSHLLTKVFRPLAQQAYHACCIVIDLRNPVNTIFDILYSSRSQLDRQVIDGKTWSELLNEDRNSRNYNLTTHFVTEISKLDKPLLILVDSVDSATDAMQTWLMDILLTQLCSQNHVRVVIAGRSLPEAHGSYVTLCHPTYQLLPIEDEEAYIDYCQHLNSRLDEQSIRNFAYAFDYIPGLFAEVIQSKFLSQGKVDG